jgi:HEAT repeat protein
MPDTYDGPFGRESVRQLVEDEDVLGLAEALGYTAVQKSKARRGEIVNELGRLGDPRAVEPLGDVLLIDPDPITRALAAKALGRLGDPAGIPALLEALDTDKEIKANQTWVIWSLGKLRAREGVDELVERLCSCELFTVRLFAARALGEIGDHRATFPLIESLTDSNRRMQRAAADALGKLGDSRALEPVRAAYESAGFFARRRIRRALVELESRFA